MLRRYFFSVFHDVVDGSAGGGATGAGAGTGGATGTGAAGGGAAAGATGATGSGAAPADGGRPGATDPNANQFTYKENRSDWHPPHVNARLAERLRRMEGEYQTLNNRIRMIMGVEAPPDPRNAQILEGLAKMNPAFARLIQNPNADKILDRLFQMVESGQINDVSGAGDAMWRRHALDMSSRARDAYAKAINVPVDKLPQSAINRIAREMNAFIQQDRTGARKNAYETGDPSFIAEFIKDITGFWVEPVRQAQPSLAARMAARVAGLPAAGRSSSGTPSGAAGGTGGKSMTKKERFAKMREGFLSASLG